MMTLICIWRTRVNIRVFLHVWFLMKSLVTINTGKRPDVSVNHQMSRQCRRSFELFVADSTSEFLDKPSIARPCVRISHQWCLRTIMSLFFGPTLLNDGIAAVNRWGRVLAVEKWIPYFYFCVTAISWHCYSLLFVVLSFRTLEPVNSSSDGAAKSSGLYLKTDCTIRDASKRTEHMPAAAPNSD